MKKLLQLLTFTLLLSCGTGTLLAQRDSIPRNSRSTSSLSLGSALLDPIALPPSLDRDVEKMLEQWYSGYGHNSRHQGTTRTTGNVAIPYAPDSVYIRMLNRMPSAMRFSYNPLVREAIELYLFKRRSLLSSMLSLADLYYPEIEVALDKHGLPMELRHLVIVESALNPKAVSPAGATGLWQLMLPTGKIYGLDVNSLVDERMDPVKSTEAACRFLKDLYRIYGDWWLVLAAYNCGPGNVNRALKRLGDNQANFWEIYRYLPNETRRYIPLFIGAYFAMHYHKEYGILPRQLGRPLATDYYLATHRVTFDRISEITGLSTDLISTFNPQFRRGIIPGNSTPYPVRLPLSAILKLDSATSEVHSPELRVQLEGPSATASTTTARSRGQQEQAGSEQSTSASSTRGEQTSARSKSTTHTTTTTHTVRADETLYAIAHRHGITVQELKKANNLRSDKVSVGQHIKIVKHQQKAQTTKKASHRRKRR